VGEKKDRSPRKTAYEASTLFDLRMGLGAEWPQNPSPPRPPSALARGIAEAAVKVHRSRAMRKMKAHSLPELGPMADKLKLAPEKPQHS
jgi:hypothetical protein